MAWPAPTTYASPDDVEAIWKPLTTTQRERAQGLLENAAVLIRSTLPAIDAWIGEGRVEASAARFASANAVRRVLSNPDGKRQEAIDDYSYTRDAVLSGGELTLTPGEVASMRPASAGASTAGAFTIRPGAPR